MSFDTVLKNNPIVVACFILPTQKACKYVSFCFKALAKKTTLPYKFILVDVNACSEASDDIEDVPTMRVYCNKRLTQSYSGADVDEMRKLVESI